MRPSCSVCQNRYNEDERCPLLLQCGHGFCKQCLSKMFSASPETTLSCPRCRHVTMVGNSVTALKKNYAILALINDSGSSSNYFSEDDEEEEDEDEERKENFGSNDEVDDDAVRRRRREAQAATSCGGGGGGSVRIEVGMHQGVKLVRRIGEGNSSRKAAGAVVEMWAAVITGSNGRCRHKVAVKKVAVGKEMDVVWVQGQLEGLRRASMWCRNVCVFHGATQMEDGSLGLVMDRCKGSVQTEMQSNEGRLTLEQILRYCIVLSCFYGVLYWFYGLLTMLLYIMVNFYAKLFTLGFLLNYARLRWFKWFGDVVRKLLINRSGGKDLK